jgi:hypothetical protein
VEEEEEEGKTDRGVSADERMLRRELVFLADNSLN